METERTHVTPLALNLFSSSNRIIMCGATKAMGFIIKQFTLYVQYSVVSACPLTKRNWNKALIWLHCGVFSKLVYFGQEGLLETLTTMHNCFITLRFVLIGTSKVAYFADCQSLACVAVQCVHNSTAEWRWIEGGVNDLTEDSVELTPATEQTICSFHQQLWSKKKKTRRGWEEMSYDIGGAVVALMRKTVQMQNAAIIVHLIAVLKRSTHTYKLEWLIFSEPKDGSCSPGRTNQVQGEKTTIKFKCSLF